MVVVNLKCVKVDNHFTLPVFFFHYEVRFLDIDTQFFGTRKRYDVVTYINICILQAFADLSLSVSNSLHSGNAAHFWHCHQKKLVLHNGIDRNKASLMFADLGLFNMRAIQIIEHCYFPALHFSECMHTQTTNPIDYHKL
jgi:hypothetical protein